MPVGPAHGWLTLRRGRCRLRRGLGVQEVQCSLALLGLTLGVRSAHLLGTPALPAGHLPPLLFQLLLPGFGGGRLFDGSRPSLFFLGPGILADGGWERQGSTGGPIWPRKPPSVGCGASTHHRGVRGHGSLAFGHLGGSGRGALVLSLLPAPSCLLFLLEGQVSAVCAEGWLRKRPPGLAPPARSAPFCTCGDAEGTEEPESVCGRAHPWLCVRRQVPPSPRNGAGPWCWGGRSLLTVIPLPWAACFPMPRGACTRALSSSVRAPGHTSVRGRTALASARE